MVKTRYEETEKRASRLLRRFAVNLRNEQVKRNMTGRAFCELIGVSYAFYLEIVRDRGNPTLMLIEKVASELGIAYEDLLKPLPNERTKIARRAKPTALDRAAVALRG